MIDKSREHCQEKSKIKWKEGKKEIGGELEGKAGGRMITKVGKMTFNIIHLSDHGSISTTCLCTAFLGENAPVLTSI